MGRPSDRDPQYMRDAHGTTRLITDYVVRPDSEAKTDPSRLSLRNRALAVAAEGIERYREALKELSDDPAEVRNADDYDDWEYGTEPIPHDDTWTRKPST
jgi:hypothetical protein